MAAPRFVNKFLEFCRKPSLTWRLSLARNTLKYYLPSASNSFSFIQYSGEGKGKIEKVDLLSLNHLFFRRAFAGKNGGSSRDVAQRQYSNGGDDRQEPFIVQLTEMPKRMYPNIIKMFRNFFFSILIRGYFDPHFTKDKFLDGVEHAIGHVSQILSRGQFEELDGLVTKDALWEVQRGYQQLTYKQQRWLEVDPKDFFNSFMYEIGVIMDDETERRMVEVTAVVQGYHGYCKAKMKGGDHCMRLMTSYPNNFYVCNYRFIRDYTKGKEDEWTINRLNHFSKDAVVMPPSGGT